MSDTLEKPIGWRVAAMKISPGKMNGGKAWTEDTVYADKDVAECYKTHLQAEGWVASVTPQYATPQTRGKAHKALQLRTAPPGFNRDWKLKEVIDQYVLVDSQRGLRVEVTPEMAAAILKPSTINRPISKGVVDALTEELVKVAKKEVS